MSSPRIGYDGVQDEGKVAGVAAHRAQGEVAVPVVVCRARPVTSVAHVTLETVSGRIRMIKWCGMFGGEFSNSLGNCTVEFEYDSEGPAKNIRKDFNIYEMISNFRDDDIDITSSVVFIATILLYGPLKSRA